MEAQVPETVEKIIKQEDVRLFRVRTVCVENLEYFDLTVTNPIEVRAGSRRIGWASLDFGGGFEHGLVVEADLVFDYASPERLSIETGAQKLYARLEGVHALAAEPFEHVGLYSERLQGVQALQVLGIEISSEPAYEEQPALGEVTL